MADFLGDVIKVFLDTRAEFTGEALKLKQVGVCRNTDQPTKGHEFIARDPDGSYYSIKSEHLQTDWGITDSTSEAYLKNKPVTFFVDTGSKLAIALNSAITNKTIMCSNNALSSVRSSLVIPTNTLVKGNNYIYGCRVAFQTFDNTIPTQLPVVYGNNPVNPVNIYMYNDFEHWSEVGYPNSVTIDSVQVHLRNVRNGDTSGGNVSYNVLDTQGVGAYLRYEATDQFGLTPDGVKEFWDNTRGDVSELVGENGNVRVTINDSGDDRAVRINGGELHVGTPADPRESCFGEGDSYPVSIAYHCEEANTSGLTITGAADITEILQSDTSSTTGLFGGTTTGKYILVGSDYPYLGVKVKMTDGGDVNPVNARLESWISSGVYNAVQYMATDANFPYTQRANNIGQSLNEQWRFGYDPTVPSSWAPVTLNINGVDVTKYWGRFVVDGGITQDPVVEQIKLHSNRMEINSTGVHEFFGLARPARELHSGLEIATANALVDPADESVMYGTGTTAKYKDNEFAQNADDGFVIVQGVDEGLDTSISLRLGLSYYVKGTSTGDIVFDVDVYQVGDGFVYDGSATPDSYSITDTVVSNSNQIRRSASILINTEKVSPSEALVISIRRNAVTNPSDTLGANVVLTYANTSGWFWR